jgi:hypothetical protein
MSPEPETVFDLVLGGPDFWGCCFRLTPFTWYNEGAITTVFHQQGVLRRGRDSVLVFKTYAETPINSTKSLYLVCFLFFASKCDCFPLKRWFCTGSESLNLC